ncbi:MAG: hypothetical protein IPN33_23060 [Saprospiraceae bacterium]|nr:hypothetical protein [Saprospiraceae bacterium]
MTIRCKWVKNTVIPPLGFAVFAFGVEVLGDGEGDVEEEFFVVIIEGAIFA